MKMFFIQFNHYLTKKYETKSIGLFFVLQTQIIETFTGKVSIVYLRKFYATTCSYHNKINYTQWGSLFLARRYDLISAMYNNYV